MNDIIRGAVGPDVELDVHLMVSNPEKWVEGMSKAGANNYTFHYEASENPQQLIKDVSLNLVWNWFSKSYYLYI